jgi:hypothetical protein
MSWERAAAHSCADGRPCIGHKVNVVYKKRETDNAGQMTRESYCSRCHQSCETECIPNQNYRDQTGRGSIACYGKKKKLKPCPVWRDPKTNLTVEEMMKELINLKKKSGYC